VTRLDFALVFDGETLDRWHITCLDRLEAVANFAGVIVTPRDPSDVLTRRGSGTSRWFRGRLRADHAPDVAGRLSHVPRYQAEQLRSSGSASFAFLLKLGPGPLPYELEHMTRLGTWFFEHEVGSSRLPFFREVYHGDHVIRAALLSTRPNRDAPTILEEAYLRTERRSYSRSRRQVLEAITTWPARACRRTQAGADDGATQAGQPGSADLHAPLLPYLTRIAWRRLAFAWGRLTRHPQWTIGILDVSAGELVEAGAYSDDEVEWIPVADRRAFVADPFGIDYGGVLHVLCESYSYRESIGDIRRLKLAAGEQRVTPVRTLALTSHASYPFLLEADGEIYCVPETSEANEVALFRATEFPSDWSKAAVLLPDFPGLDPTVFHHDGLWWLFCTRKGALADVELWAWHSSSVLGPWTEHARNPIKSDVRGSRPGGRPFHHCGVLYRPAQDCSQTYGWRIALQRVKDLTPTEFQEEPLMVIQASPRSPYPRGRHTLTPVGDKLLLDGRRDIFVLGAFCAFLKIWGADLAGRARGGAVRSADGRR
jgi:hypothetical protein